MRYLLNFIFILASCSAVNHIDPDKIEGYQIYRTMPLITQKGEINSYDTAAIQAYYYKGLTLLRLGYSFSSEDENDSVTADNEYRHRYLVFKQGDAYGYEFDTRNIPEKAKVRLDSALRFEWLVKNDLSGLFMRAKPQLTKEMRQGDSITQIYKIYDLNDGKFMADCELRYSTSLPPLNISICKQIDTVKNMKLYYYAFTVSPEKIRQDGIISGVFRSEYILTKIPVEDEKEILRYFKSM